MLIKLAWRNIWRNRRRTLITSAAVMFAVFFSVFMESIQRGAWDHMLDNVVNFYYGYAQVHQKGYWDEPSLDLAMPADAAFVQRLRQTPGVQDAVPRVETFALAAYDQQTTGIMVVGADPAAENALTRLQTHLSKGNYWADPASPRALVAEGVASRLQIGVGDTIVLLSQGYRGVNAAGKYPVGGLLRFGSPDLNKRMVYLTLPVAQQWLGAEGVVTTLALKIPDKQTAPGVVAALNSGLDTTQYEVMDWQQMIPELVEAKALDSAGNKLVMLVLYIIITFGILGAILMMIKEREREFGVLIGIGMQRLRLAFTVWLEVVFMGLLGVGAGIVLGLPLVYYFHLNPIDLSVMGEEAVKTYEKFGMEPVLPAVVEPGIFIGQALVILIITTILAIYPLWRLARMEPVQAMRA